MSSDTRGTAFISVTGNLCSVARESYVGDRWRTPAPRGTLWPRGRIELLNAKQFSAVFEYNWITSHRQMCKHHTHADVQAPHTRRRTSTHACTNSWRNYRSNTYRAVHGMFSWARSNPNFCLVLAGELFAQKYNSSSMLYASNNKRIKIPQESCHNYPHKKPVHKG